LTVIVKPGATNSTDAGSAKNAFSWREYWCFVALAKLAASTATIANTSQDPIVTR